MLVGFIASPAGVPVAIGGAVGVMINRLALWESPSSGSAGRNELGAGIVLPPLRPRSGSHPMWVQVADLWGNERFCFVRRGSERHRQYLRWVRGYNPIY